MAGLEYKVFNFGKQKHAEYSVNNCESIRNYTAVKYKHGRPEMTMAIKKIDNPTTYVSDFLEDIPSRVEIFIWENKCK